MVIDYKGTSFSFKKIRQAKRLKQIRVIGIILLIIFSYFLVTNILESGKIKKIQVLLLENKTAEASARFKQIESSLFHPSTRKELKALIHLFSDEYPQAEEILTGLGDSSTSIACGEFLGYFSDRAEYRKLGIYTDYLMQKSEKIDNGEELPFYKALYKTGMFDFRQSAETIRQMSPGLRKKKEIQLALVSRINEQLKSGKINYIFDSGGNPLAYYDMVKKKTVSLAPGISFDDFTADFEKSIKFYRLTLDMRVQAKIHRLFRHFNGSFLLFNLNDSGIAAAYSKPVDKKKANTNTVFYETYEPGSILKILTMFAFLKFYRKDLDVFPFHCKGLWQMGDKTFYDWKTHNRVETSQEALAVSCNVAFARIAVGVGAKRLTDIFNRFYFNSPGLSDQFLTFKTGKTSGNISTDYRLANMAVGLSEVSITTFHSALLSAVFSQNGSIYTPHLIMNKKNLLNLGFYNHNPQLVEIIKENRIFFKVKNAMAHVVEGDDGTGRRAGVDFVKVALKTGTAGDKKVGFDAVLTGFFPADKPQYAFAFRLERGGRAELNGARFLKDFLIAFYR